MSLLVVALWVAPLWGVECWWDFGVCDKWYAHAAHACRSGSGFLRLSLASIIDTSCLFLLQFAFCEKEIKKKSNQTKHKSDA